MEQGYEIGSLDGPYSLYDASSTSGILSLGTEIQHIMEDLGKLLRAGDRTSTMSVCLSKDMLEAALVTIELLYGEVKKWEEGSRKLMTDVERLRKELHKRSRPTKI